ncbi:Helicase associated domain protein [Kitasatospora sp. NPDC088783]|uniref:DEAD/DEAH box helicase n=1 Tax=Kitasatospora sp. NPDC088783 TaxID=3364077 RepID=UPI0037F54410
MPALEERERLLAELDAPTIARFDLFGLRPHQRVAVAASLRTAADHDRFVVTQPCGTGKTREAAAIADLLMPPLGGRLLLAAHTVDVLAQTVEEWIGTCGREWLGDIVAVCGRREVLKEQARIRGWGAWITTDPAEIARLVAGGRRTTILVTYQSLPKVIDAHRAHGMPPTHVAVGDEAHRTVGTTTWSDFHDEALLPAGKRISMTATLKAVPSDDDNAISLDRPEQVGPIAYNLLFDDAVGQGLITDYHLLIAAIGDRELRDIVASRAHLPLGDDDVEAATFAKAAALLRAAHTSGSRKIVTYHSTIREARRFTRVLTAAQNWLPARERPASLWTGHVSGAQPPAARERIVNRFRKGDPDGLAVLTNSKMLTTGWNVPEVDGVAILDPRHSVVELIQILGRAIRLDPSNPRKRAAFIVTAMTDATDGYAETVSAVLALAATDDRMAKDLKRLRTARHAPHHPTGPGRLPQQIAVVGHDVPARLVDAITVQVLASTASDREHHLEALDAYWAENGTLATVPADWVSPAGVHAGRWLENIRGRQRALPSTLREWLGERGVVWNKYEQAWKETLNYLIAFHAQHHHLVPVKGTEFQGRDISALMNSLRSRYPGYSKERREQLAKIGFVPNVHEARFEENMLLFARHVETTGKTHMPEDHLIDGVKVGAWFNEIRDAALAGTLPAARRKRFTDLGVTFVSTQEIKREEAFADWIDLGTAYLKETGKATISTKAHFRGKHLGQWYNSVLRYARQGTLTPSRRAAVQKAFGVALPEPATTPANGCPPDPGRGESTGAPGAVAGPGRPAAAAVPEAAHRREPKR